MEKLSIREEYWLFVRLGLLSTLAVLALGRFGLSVDARAVEPPRVTSNYGDSRVKRKNLGPGLMVSFGRHSGIDFAAPAGTPILSASYGLVVGVWSTRCSGGHITVQHPVKYGDYTNKSKKRKKTIYLTYIHLKSLVKVGNSLMPGQIIAFVANSRTLACARGDHLHFMLSYSKSNPAGRSINPNLFWENGINKITCFDKNKIYSKEKLALVAPLKCE